MRKEDRLAPRDLDIALLTWKAHGRELEGRVKALEAERDKLKKEVIRENKLWQERLELYQEQSRRDERAMRKELALVRDRARRMMTEHQEAVDGLRRHIEKLQCRLIKYEGTPDERLDEHHPTTDAAPRPAGQGVRADATAPRLLAQQGSPHADAPAGRDGGVVLQMRQLLPGRDSSAP